MPPTDSDIEIPVGPQIIPDTPSDAVCIGDRARDRITGFEGVATVDYRMLAGYRELRLAAADNDGKPHSFTFDDVRVDLISRAATPLILPTPTIPLGAKVRDLANRKWVGIVIGHYFNAMGCVQLEIAGPGKTKNGPRIHLVLNQNDVEMIEELAQKAPSLRQRGPESTAPLTVQSRED